MSTLTDQARYTKLKAFLRENNGAAQKDPRQDAFLETIVNDLEMIDISPPAEIYRRVPLQINHHYSGVIDLAIFEGEEFFVVKARKTEKRRAISTEISRQLQAAESFLQKNFNITPKLIGVYQIGNSPIEVYEIELPE